jgi:hypothetical protein
MNENLTEPHMEKRLLSPIERMSEILFGLIMALTFTCTISVIEANRAEVKSMLIGAIGCNVAWGLVDAVMYLLMTMTEKGRGLTVYNFVRNTTDVRKAHRFIAETMPPVIASNMRSDEMEGIRQKLLQMPQQPKVIPLLFKDFKMALAIFFLVFVSTFPVVIPFIFIQNLQTALRTSNGVAIVLMFLCGWSLAKYAGRNCILMGVIMSLVGIALVLITIALGG